MMKKITQSIRTGTFEWGRTMEATQRRRCEPVLSEERPIKLFIFLETHLGVARMGVGSGLPRLTLYAGIVCGADRRSSLSSSTAASPYMATNTDHNRHHSQSQNRTERHGRFFDCTVIPSFRRENRSHDGACEAKRRGTAPRGALPELCLPSQHVCRTVPSSHVCRGDNSTPRHSKRIE